jgi:hypothetical protein
MPWEPKEAKAHTVKANTAPKQKQWADVADKVLAQSGDEKKAIVIANGVVKNHPARRMHGDGVGHFSGH